MLWMILAGILSQKVHKKYLVFNKSVTRQKI
jgi:hypothetical protein